MNTPAITIHTIALILLLGNSVIWPKKMPAATDIKLRTTIVTVFLPVPILCCLTKKIGYKSADQWVVK